MKKWFDTETGAIVTEQELRREHWAWMCERVTEDGLEWAKAHPEDYTFEVFVENCTTPWNGTLIPVYDVTR